MNERIYQLALWLDGTDWSTSIHESYYLYNWIEATHVLTLTLSLGLLLLIDLRVLGLALPSVPIRIFNNRIRWPMLIGFSLMIITGLLLLYAVPVRTVQSLWFRIKLLLLLLAAVNALVFHYLLGRYENLPETGRLPGSLRIGAGISIGLWVGIVTCGRLIAYDWFDCVMQPDELVSTLAGCLSDQEVF